MLNLTQIKKSRQEINGLLVSYKILDLNCTEKSLQHHLLLLPQGIPHALLFKFAPSFFQNQQFVLNL